MNKYSVFISFSSVDEDVVKLFSNLIKRVSLNQIDIWFSNDKERNGGINAGQNWYSVITDNIEKSSRVIAFITENSINSPWLTYETGYSDGLKTCDYLPVRFGVKLDDVPAPLRVKHVSSLNSIRDMNSFLDKLLNMFDITYDQEAFEKAVNNAWTDMRTMYIAPTETTPLPDLAVLSSKIESLENKIDNYLGAGLKNIDSSPISEYDIEILLPMGNGLGSHMELFSIRQDTTFEEVLNEIYFSLNGLVRPFTYLESWVLIERTTQVMAIISDVQEFIPAYRIFSKNSQWEVRLIDNGDVLLSKEKAKVLKKKLMGNTMLSGASLVKSFADIADADYWYNQDKGLLKIEVNAMSKLFPQFKLTNLKDGRLAWLGDVHLGAEKKKTFSLLVAYDNDFPTNKNWNGLIRVYIVSPDLSDFKDGYGHGIPHTLKDNDGSLYLCTAKKDEVGIGRARTSAASTLAWAIKWLNILELYMSGEVSYEEFMKYSF